MVKRAGNTPKIKQSKLESFKNTRILEIFIVLFSLNLLLNNSAVGEYYKEFAGVVQRISSIYPPYNNSNSSSLSPIYQPSPKPILIPFEKHDGVVIATKIHGHHLINLQQSLCLLHHAYNHRPLYDIVVFTAEPLDASQIEQTQDLVAPANLTVVVDNRGFQEEVAALNPVRRANFLASCQNASSSQNLSWWSECPGRIAYNWQAEFRSWHIWKHPALADYQYMMWLDSDAFATQPWQQDPVTVMLQNNLVVMFDNFPGGSSRPDPDVVERI